MLFCVFREGEDRRDRESAAERQPAYLGAPHRRWGRSSGGSALGSSDPTIALVPIAALVYLLQ